MASGPQARVGCTLDKTWLHTLISATATARQELLISACQNQWLHTADCLRCVAWFWGVEFGFSGCLPLPTSVAFACTFGFGVLLVCVCVCPCCLRVCARNRAIMWSQLRRNSLAWRGGVNWCAGRSAPFTYAGAPSRLPPGAVPTPILQFLASPVMNVQIVTQARAGSPHGHCLIDTGNCYMSLASLSVSIVCTTFITALSFGYVSEHQAISFSCCTQHHPVHQYQPAFQARSDSMLWLPSATSSSAPRFTCHAVILL